MPSPSEAAQKVAQTQVKKLQTIVKFVQKAGKKLKPLLSKLVSALKFLVSKLSQISALIPSWVVSSTKSIIKLFQKVAKDLNQKIVKLVRLVVTLGKSLKEAITKRLLRIIIANVNNTMMLIDNIANYVADIIATIKPLQKLYSALKSAETAIKYVVEEISDIIAALLEGVGLKKKLAPLGRKFKDAMKSTKELAKQVEKMEPTG